jgi:L-lactate dehydrogenase complex protein LldG
MNDSTRKAFLERVRQAVRAGNRPGSVPPLPERGNLGHQGAGPDPVGRFRQEWQAAGGRLHVVTDATAASAVVLGIVGSLAARRVLLGSGAVLETLSLSEPLAALGVEVVRVADLGPADRAAFFAADVGISGVAALIAETGSLVVESGPDEPRSLSLLPPVHVAVAHRDQLLADLFDLFDPPRCATLPSALTLITGPSKTGDIELKLVTGVHGPGTVHVVLISP